MDEFLPCPICGCIEIGLKRNVITDVGNGRRVKLWAYCKECNHRSMTVTDIYLSEEDEIVAGVLLWNKPIQSNQ